MNVKEKINKCLNMCKKKCFSMLSICKDLKNIIQKSVKVITLVSSVFTKKSRNVYHVDE